MGSGPKLKPRQRPTASNLEEGSYFLNKIKQQSEVGLDPESRAILESQGKEAISGNLAATQADITRSLYATGGGSPGAEILGRVKAGEGANKAVNNLYRDITQENVAAKERAFGKYSTLTGLELGESGQANEYNLGEYEGNVKSREAKINMVGELISGGSKLAAAAI